MDLKKKTVFTYKNKQQLHPQFFLRFSSAKYVGLFPRVHLKGNRKF